MDKTKIKTRTSNIFEHHDEVRDSELDLQGIVNNSNYFVYMEHARHKHLKSLGLDFKKLHDDGYDLVLSEVQMKFKAPLKSQDRFIITSIIQPKGNVRVLVTQTIIRESDNKIMTEANFIITCINNQTGKIYIPEFITDKLFA